MGQDYADLKPKGGLFLALADQNSKGPCLRTKVRRTTLSNIPKQPKAPILSIFKSEEA